MDRLGESGKAFWAAVSEWWDMMDKIQHAEMANVFEFFMEQWDPDCLSQECREALDTLPFGRPIRIYRGQDEGQEPGLAWTLDREKAEWFARAGLRGMTKNDRPVVLVAEVLRVDIALASNARNESEVVPFTVPTIRETIRLY